jgi:hypothetical protein
MYFVLPPGLPCCRLYNHLLLSATVALCPLLGVGVDGTGPKKLSSNAVNPAPDPKLHLLLPATVARRTSPLTGLPESEPPEPKVEPRSPLPPSGLLDVLRASGELPAVAMRLLVALTARGVVRT